MSEKIEHVAKAIYEGRNGAGCRAWGSLPKAHQQPYLDDARAAIAALRDHYKERRGDPRLYGQGFSDPYIGLIVALDTALSE